MKVLYILLIALCTGCYPTQKVGGPKMLGHEYMNSQMGNSRGCEVMTKVYDDMQDLNFLTLNEKIYLADDVILNVELGPFQIFKEVPLISIQIPEESCVMEYDEVIFKFEDGDTKVAIHDDGFNCNGIYTFNLALMGRGSLKRKFKDFRFTKVRIYNDGNFRDYDIRPIDQRVIHAAMNCIL